MARTKSAYQRIADVEVAVAWEVSDDDMILPPSQMALDKAQIDATLAVAQATVELAGELDAIRATIANLR